MKPKSPLYVFRLEDCGEVFWYIASSERHAQDLFFFEHANYSLLEQYHNKKMRKSSVINYTRADWGNEIVVEQLPDDKEFTIMSEDNPELSEVKTCREWIWENDNKPGLLATTCW